MKIYIIAYYYDDYHDKIYHDRKDRPSITPIEVRLVKKVNTRTYPTKVQIGWDFEGNPLYKYYSYDNDFEIKEVEEIVTYYGWILDDFQSLPQLMKEQFFDLCDSELKVVSATDDDIIWEARC